MSTTTDGPPGFPVTPQSSRKRKTHGDASEPSKKKRKHDKQDTEALASQETTTSSKEKKKKKKAQEEQNDSEPITAPEIEDMEVTNASVRQNYTTFEDSIEMNDVTNGIDVTETAEDVTEIDSTILESKEPSCFYEKRLSLQLPIPAISLASPTSSLLSLHLTPLLLTYFPPADGIVLSFSDPVLSAQPNFGVNLPLQRPKSNIIPRSPSDETFARCADAYGVCWVWLTVTFLVFHPKTGDALKGWSNVTSEGFVGLVSYNYFQTAVGKNRIPSDWIWDGPTRESKSRKRARKGKLRDEDGVAGSQQDLHDTQESSLTYDTNEGGSGSFVDAAGDKISATQTFRVVDVEMVPGHERDRWTLQIDGSLLSSDEEEIILAEERQRFEHMQNRSRSRSKTPGLDSGEMPLVSGEISFSREASPLP